MKATTKAIIAALVAVAAALGIIVWQARHGSAHAALTSLSPEDMSLIAESLSPTDRTRLASSPEERKKLAEDIKQILAVAAEAREKGVADRPEVRRQLDAMQMLVVAQMYVKKQRDANAKPEDYRPKQEELDAYLKDPQNIQKADGYLEDLKKMGMVPEDQPITDEIKEQFRQQWAPMAILAQKGKAAGIESDRSTQLQVQFQQAVALSRIYSNELSKKLEPNDQEIEAYFAAHPDLDPKAARQKAEDLLKRARAGEDFDKLAKENSEEPGAKESGGDLGWFGRGRMVKPFEEAAFTLKDNEISDVVESQFGYHIIQVLGHRTGKPEPIPGAPPAAADKDAQPEEQIHARHILIKTGGQSQNPFAPPKSARDTAKEAILEEKTKKEVEEISKRTSIKVPEDFPVKAPEAGPQMPMSPHGGAGMEGPPPGDEEMPPPPAAGQPNSGKPSGGAKPKPEPGKKK